MSIAIRSRSKEDRTSHYDYAPVHACLEMLNQVDNGAAVIEDSYVVPALVPAPLTYTILDPAYPHLHEVQVQFGRMENATKNLEVFCAHLTGIETVSTLLQRYMSAIVQFDASPIHALDLGRYIPQLAMGYLPEPPLIEAIRALAPAGPTDEGELARGESAKNDAVEFVARYCANSLAAADLSDGVVSLHWRKGADGLMVIFLGDRQIEYSVHSGNRLFTDNATAFSPQPPLPEELAAILHDMVQG